MLHLLTSPEAWMSFLTLSALEIVLGVDNVIFLSIVSARLPAEQQRTARRIGLGLALFARVGLLASLAWIIGLTEPVFRLGGFEASWRDIILAAGGAFLIYKATVEIHETMEPEDGGQAAPLARARAAFGMVIGQIVVLDVVFSLDSVLTAIGMANEIAIMIAAVCVAIGVMLVAAEPLARFVNTHPTVKMLALSFLILVGVALVADALHFHIPRGYLYFAIAFSIGVETLNLMAGRRRRREREAAAAGSGGTTTLSDG